VPDPTQRATSDVAVATDPFAARLGLPVLHLEVAAAATVTPTVRCIRLAGPQLVGFTHDAGQDLMLTVPDGGRSVRRRYTIAAADPVSGHVDLDVVVHGDGPGARWAAAAAVGDQVDAIGPRGKITLDPTAAWHLFAGDEAFLPAAAAMVAALPASGRALVVLEVEDAAEERPITGAAAVETVWVHRAGTRRSGALADAVDDLALPGGAGHAYVGGELTSVQAVVERLARRGFPGEQVSGKAYWRLRTPNAEHGEPPPG
jgi:NADPH-dependent ferric siderophore reductase